MNYQSQLAGTDSDDEDINDWVKEIMDSTAKRHRSVLHVAEMKTFALKVIRFLCTLSYNVCTFCSSSSKAKGFGSHVNNIKMRNPLMMLRKCCSHPYLLSQPIGNYFTL